MAFRLPRFVFLHAARAAGLANISCTAASVAGFPKVRLIDGRAKALAKFVSGADVAWTIDRGAAGLTAVDRIIIPAGHNLHTASTNFTVYSDNDSAFGTPTLMYAHGFGVPAGLLNFEMTSSSERYIRLTVYGTAAWEMGELWLGQTRAAVGGVFDPKWRNTVFPSLVRHEFPSGEVAALELGEAKTSWGFEHKWLSGSDLAVYEDLAAAVGYGRDVFYFDPPDNADPATLVEFLSAPDKQQDSSQPKTVLSYTYKIELAESKT